MNDETRLDNELANFTDSLLAGEDVQTGPEIEALAQVVRQFHRVIEPDSGPAPAFRDQLAQRLDQEWMVIQEEHKASSDEQAAQYPVSQRRSHSMPTRESWQVDLPPQGSETNVRSIFGGWRRNRTVQVAAMAATVAVALLVAVLIAASPEGSTSGEGTASGGIDWPVIIGIVVVGLLGLLVFWLGQRSKS